MKIDQTLLLRVLKLVKFAMSRDDSRYILQSVQLETEAPDKLLAVATDGRRIAIAEIGVALNGDEPFKVAVPDYAVKLLLKNVAKKGEAELSKVGEGWVFRFESDHKTRMTLEFNPVDGTYPNWRMAIPDKFGADRQLLLNPEYLASGLDVEGFNSMDVKLPADESSGCQFSANDPKDGTSFKCVIMPMRSP